MRKRLATVAAVAVCLFGGGIALAQQVSQTEEHVVPYALTVAGHVAEGSVTITDEDVLPTVTVVETVTVTETTPPPSSPPPPVEEPPPANSVITDRQFVCNGPVNLDLLRIQMNAPSSDALVLASNCTGRIGRVEIEGPMADGIKVQNANANAAHDLVIESGYVFCGRAAEGVHQDGMQAMGGSNITFRNLVIDCLGGGGGNLFPARGGSGATTPTNIVCVNCAIGPRHPNPVQIQHSTDSGIRDSLVCRSEASGRAIIVGTRDVVRPVNVNNEIAPVGDPRCTREGLLNHVRG